MPTSLANGTVTADGTEQVLAADTSNKNVVLVVDTSTLINGETLELRIYTKCLSGGAEVLAYFATFTNAQDEPMKYSVPVPADISVKATLKQAVYVTGYKNFPWNLLSLV